MSGAARRLIVNADDFGHSDAVNAGIVHAHEHGIVTSTSLMVNREAAAEAAAYARENDRLDVGLHVDLGEWHHSAEHGWRATREVPREAIPREVRRQVERFRTLVGRDPTHVDSHQHVHLDEPARSPVLAVAGELGVPVRHVDGRIRYCGDFYGQMETGEPLPDFITPAALVRVIEALSSGVTELCCHPARGAVPHSSYARERELELVALCDAGVRATVERERIELVSFATAFD